MVRPFLGSEVLTAAIAGTVVIFLLFLAGLSRYLLYRENMRLYERTDDVTPFLEARERRQNWWGRLHGVRMVLVGSALVFWYWLTYTGQERYTKETRGLVLTLSLVLISMGLFTSISYARWSREEEQRRHPPAPEQAATRERQRLHRGFVLGVFLVLCAVFMSVLAAAYAALGENYRLRDYLYTQVVKLNPLEEVVYLLGAGFLFVVGLTIALLYAWAGRRFRREQARRPAVSSTPEESSA